MTLDNLGVMITHGTIFSTVVSLMGDDQCHLSSNIGVMDYKQIAYNLGVMD